ncbi:hypothetical protein TAL182_PE00019 (plasmid) [Rhizobium sp. TAL182]|nr:hypothetical protein TAL182_PE00019 [Rhizobium sp. TAL182]
MQNAPDRLSGLPYRSQRLSASVFVATAPKAAGLRDRDDIVGFGYLRPRHVRPMPDDISLLHSGGTPRPQMSCATALA